MRTTKYLFTILSFLFIATVAQASPLARDQVPEPLKPWIDWALKDHEKDLCPFLNGSGAGGECAWPSPLILTFTDKGGNFSQSWRLYSDDWVPLPGDDKRWPLDVKVDGKPASVILREDQPEIYLKPGDHTLQGTFAWDSLPESFSLAKETGVLKLTVKGSAVIHPNINDDGLLWLQSKETKEASEDSLDAHIFRQMDDDIPFVLTTALDLDVAGKTREAVFSSILLGGFIPMALESPLPAHLDADGKLKVQIRSGHWQIRLKARHEGPVNEIVAPKTEDGAPQVWSFLPHNDLRLVTIEGVQAVDPNQTTLPDDWKRLAAYSIQPGETVKLVEQRRGDADSSGAGSGFIGDQLTLNRQIWLDFDGHGYTVQDQIGGNFSRNTRLEMNPSVKVGRVANDGVDQLITRVPGSNADGVEVRQGPANIAADSRIDGKKCSIPAVGWRHDFQNVAGTLNLPPGWRAFAIWGADHVPNTWLNGWTLLDIFLAMILSLSFAKIWNVKWGFIALATLTLTFPEYGAPMWTWLAVLVGEALIRLLPTGFKGKIRIPLKLYRAGAIIILIAIAVPFAATSLRQAFYPSLQQPMNFANASYDLGVAGGLPMPAAAPEAVPPPPPQEEQALGKARDVAAPVQRAMKMAMSQSSRQLFDQIPGAQVQTGPGLPRWHWTTIPLQWSGPVAKDQTLRLILLGPCSNLILALVRVLLMALLLLRIIDFPGKFWPGFMKKHLIAGLAVMMVLIMTVSPRPARADFPTPDILNQLKDRLLQKPECTPNCASISRLKIEATPATLRLRIDVSAQAPTAIPLPSNAKEWMPQQISIDGNKFAGVRRSDDGQVWIELAPGAHQVVIEGPLGDRSSVQIPLPLKPYHVEASGPSIQGWTVSGLHEDGEAEGNLQLTRTQALKSSEKSNSGAPAPLPPFVRVERHLVLGLKWTIETTIIRLTPSDSSIVLDVPLLPGESVTTDGIRVNDGKVMVSMAPQTDEFTWSSVLQQVPEITLRASSSMDWSEQWRLTAGSVWHVDATGIPMIPPQRSEAGSSQWQPWPAEQVTLKISRPEGVPGPTVTIDHSSLAVSPGLRFTEATLALELRSSLGGQHTVMLPKTAELQSVAVNGQTQPIRLLDGKITLPLAPGSQNFEIKWQQPGGVGFFFHGPAVDLGAANVNADIQFQYPERWVLLVGGPRLGPAVLFWSLLLVMILVAVGLSRSGLTPLSTIHWIVLSLGLTQTPVWASMIFAGWFLALGWRQKNPRSGAWSFDLTQITLVIWTATAVGILFSSIYQGLLGSPDMQIEGNSSTSVLLHWFQDRSAGLLPRPWVFSLPMFCYRLAMLGWALWVAWAFIGWLKWAWKGFSMGGVWKPVTLVASTKKSKAD